jgi:hypothetical protein
MTFKTDFPCTFADRRAIRRWSTLALIAGVLAACQSSPPPDKMARATTDSAPADLQLQCANEAAKVAKVDSTKILPTSSAKLDDQTYTVQLNADGKPFTCTIDANGTVKSVVPATT